MSSNDDDEHEMFRRTDLDDDAIERLLTGHRVPGEDLLVSFVEDARTVDLASVTPSADLAALFAEGFSTEDGDLLATAASNVPGPGNQAAGLPKWRKRKMFEIALGKLAAMGLAAKMGVATGAVALTGTAAAATGTLPPAAQERVAEVAEQVGIDIPGGKSAEHRRDADHRRDEERQADEEETVDTAAVEGSETDVDEIEGDEKEAAENGGQSGAAEKPEAADFGDGVSDDARSGAPQEDGKAFGDGVSDDARATHQPTQPATAEENPGTEHRPDAATKPAEAPPADQRGATPPAENPPAEQPPAETPRAETPPQSEQGMTARPEAPAAGRPAGDR